MKNYIALLKDKRVLNSFWALSEKTISLFGLIFIVSAVAKYVGPVVYGKMAFAGGIFLLIKTMSQLGLDQLYFKYLSKGKIYADYFLNNAVVLISGIYFVLSMLLIFVYNIFDWDGGIFFVAYFVAYYFSAIDLFHGHNEAKLLSKYNTIAIVFGLVLSLLIRWCGVYFNLNYIFLAYSIVVFTFIPVLVKYFIYKKNLINRVKIKYKYKYKYKYRKYFLCMGSLLSISILINILNLQVATYFLGFMKEFDEVGLYSVAFTMAGAWCIIPTTIILSYLPKMFKLNNDDYHVYIKKLFYCIMLITFFISLLYFYIGPSVISYLYGEAYFESVILFKYILLGQVFWVLSFLFIKILIKFDQNLYLLKRSVLCILTSLCCSIALYREIGVAGVALSYLISEIVGFFYMFLNSKSNLMKIVF